MKFIKLLICFVAVLPIFLTGCASVERSSASSSSYAKEFNTPPKGYAGLYIYRKATLGVAQKKSLYVDGQYIGETDRNCFFYRLVKPGVHFLQTESEFSENRLRLNAEEGKNYYINQRMKLGVFVNGASLRKVSEATAQRDIRKLGRAKDQDNKSLNLENKFEGDGSIPVPKSKKEAKQLELSK